jgi:hypothetical protein
MRTSFDRPTLRPVYSISFGNRPLPLSATEEVRAAKRHHQRFFSGLLEMPVIGRFSDGIGEFFANDRLRDRPIVAAHAKPRKSGPTKF